MVDLLVGIQVACLPQDLVGVLHKTVLIVQLNLGLQAVHVALFVSQLGHLELLLACLIISLEVALCLHVVARLSATKPIALSDETWSVRAWLVVQERVGVRWLGSKPCGWYQFYKQQKWG